MKKGILIILAGLAVITVLAACSVVKAGTTTQNTSGTGANPGGQFSDPAAMAVEQKLAIGTLKIEGTDQAVTAAQAKELLPLWQALKSLAASNNTATDEINALYAQIEETMTPAQIQAIQALTWTQEDLAAIREKYGVQGFGGDAAGRPTVSADQRATRQAQFQASGGTNGGGDRGGGPAGGFPAGGGGAPPDGGGFPQDGGGFQGRANGTPQAARTPSAAQINRQAMGFNSLFADAVIKLLEERAK
jgi:hypothetical protein